MLPLKKGGKEMVQTAQPQVKIGILMMIHIVFKDANSLLLSF